MKSTSLTSRKKKLSTNNNINALHTKLKAVVKIKLVKGKNLACTEFKLISTQLFFRLYFHQFFSIVFTAMTTASFDAQLAFVKSCLSNPVINDVDSSTFRDPVDFLDKVLIRIQNNFISSTSLCLGSFFFCARCANDITSCIQTQQATEKCKSW